MDEGAGKSDKLVRVKVWDKPKALEILAKHHGLLKERLNIDTKRLRLREHRSGPMDCRRTID